MMARSATVESPLSVSPSIAGSNPVTFSGRERCAPGASQSANSATESNCSIPRSLWSWESALKCCARDALAVSALQVAN